MRTLWRRCAQCSLRVFLFLCNGRDGWWGNGSWSNAGWGFWYECFLLEDAGVGNGWECRQRSSLPAPCHFFPPCQFQVDYMDENEEYFQRQASHRQSRRRFRKINQKGERQTIIDTVDPYPAGKPPIARGYHTVSCSVHYSVVFIAAAVGR